MALPPTFAAPHNTSSCEAETPRDVPNQFLEFNIPERYADFAAHQPGGFIGTKSHIATDVERAHALLAREHQMHDAEPFTQGLVGVFKNRPNQHRKPIADSAR